MNQTSTSTASTTVLENDEGILTSLRYYDDLRQQVANEVTREPKDNNLDVLPDQSAICHLSVILPFSGGDYAPRQVNHEDGASIALAAHHLNTRNGILVPEVAAEMMQDCPLQFTVEFSDTQFSGGITLDQIVEQLTRELPYQKPCAFVGAYRSSISIPSSMATGLFGHVQMSGASTSADLDDKSQYPLFARTVPSDAGNAIPIIRYMREVLNINHLTVVNVNDAFGNAFVEGMRNAALEYAPDMKLHQIPLDEGQGSIETAVSNIKARDYRYVFCLVFTDATHDALLEEAYKQGVAGTGVHNWLFADSFAGTLDGRSFVKDSPLHKSYQGVGLLEVSGGVPGIPAYDAFAAQMATLHNPTDLEYLGELYPKHDHPDWPDPNPILSQPDFLKTIVNGYTPFAYEATIALGLSACAAVSVKNNSGNLTMTGPEHYAALMNTTFSSISGKVVLNPDTGTREPISALYRVANYVAQDVDDDTVQFTSVVSDLFLEGAWESVVEYTFNDGTNNLPADLPPPPPEENGVNLGVAIGVPVAVALLLGVVVFLFYETKRKQNDSVWKVRKEELVFDDPPEIIGRGTFGLVLMAEYRGTKVAVKRVIPPRGQIQGSSAAKKGKQTHSTVSSTGSLSNRSNGSASGDNSSQGSGGGSGDYGSNRKKNKRYGENIDSVVEDDEENNNSNPGMRSLSGTASGYQLGGMASGFASLSARKKSGRQSMILGRQSEAANWRRLKQEFMEEMRYLSKLRHPCVTTVMGAVIDKGNDPMLIMEYMDHGSLYDLLHNETVVIEGELLLPVLRDISQGVRFLHSADPQVIHGDLKAQNILVDTKFRAKVADFGLSQKKNLGGTGTPFWMAPELLRGESTNTAATDVYSFGIILYEVYSRRDPYEGEEVEDVLRLVADKTICKRPPVPVNMPPKIKSLMADCVEDDFGKRPSFEELDVRIKRIDSENVDPGFGAPKTKTSSISLFDIFPRHIAEALRDGRTVEAEHKDSVTIFFSDIVGFTTISSTLDPRKVATLLDRLYTKFDMLSRKHDIFKVETIGDAYMAVTNLVKDQADDHAKRIAEFAIDAISVANETLIDEDEPEKGFINIRVGFHSGSVVADVVGTRNPRYCLFGDTVNTASRMESNSKVNRIHCSSAAADLLAIQCPDLPLKSRGMVHIKGKGDMHTFWVNETSSHSKKEKRKSGDTTNLAAWIRSSNISAASENKPASEVILSKLSTLDEASTEFMLSPTVTPTASKRQLVIEKERLSELLASPPWEDKPQPQLSQEQHPAAMLDIGDDYEKPLRQEVHRQASDNFVMSDIASEHSC